MMMIDHVSVRVTNLERSIAFYEKVLAPLGYEKVMAFPEGVAFGPKGHPVFSITTARGAVDPVHIAFASPTRDAVDAFYKVALAAGALDNGAPGIRKEYHPNYYGAFVLDLDGHNVEAVIHTVAA